MGSPPSEPSEPSAARRTSTRTVALWPTSPSREGVYRAVADAMEAARWREHVEPGRPVALKPNLGFDKLVPGAISGPWVFDAVVRVLAGRVGRIHVVESDQVVVRAEDALRVSGLGRVVEERGLEFVNMSRGPYRRVRDPARLALRDVLIPEILLSSQLVTVACLKTHNKTALSGALKNQWGCLHALRHNYHPRLPEALVDVNTLLRPRFAVLDGTVGLEGDGPKSGRPREMGLVLASADPVGVDSAAARIMGIDPARVPMLTLAAAHGLGSLDPELAPGSAPLAPASPPFAPAAHNAVSWLELALRRPFVERLVFHSPLLRVACWGARRYYDLWYALGGGRASRAFLRESAYREQWGGRRAGC